MTCSCARRAPCALHPVFHRWQSALPLRPPPQAALPAMAPLRVAPACAGARLRLQPAPRGGSLRAPFWRRCCPPAPRAAAAPGPGRDATEAIALTRQVLETIVENLESHNIKSERAFLFFLDRLPSAIRDGMKVRRAEAEGALPPAAGAPTLETSWSLLVEIWPLVQPVLAKRAAAAVDDARAAAVEAAAAAVAPFAKYWPLPLPANQQDARLQPKQDRPAEPAAAAAPAVGSSSSSDSPASEGAAGTLAASAAQQEASGALVGRNAAAETLAAEAEAALQRYLALREESEAALQRYLELRAAAQERAATRRQAAR